MIASATVLAVIPMILSLPSSFLAFSIAACNWFLDIAQIKHVPVDCALTHIILAQMNPLAAHSEGHVHAVVDEERNIVLLGHLVQSFRNRDEVPSVACLVPILYQRDATAEGSVYDVTNILVAKNRGRGICDQIEAVIDRRATGRYRGGHEGRQCVGRGLRDVWVLVDVTVTQFIGDGREHVIIIKCFILYIYVCGRTLLESATCWPCHQI